MDYDLSRVDYILCGITYPDTLKILPASGQKPLHKFAVGDKNGVLQCLSIKDEEPIIHFKTLPGKSITSLQIATTNGTFSDKMYAASGNEVKGFTRKGKVFLTLETSVSETITSMCIIDSYLILCCGRTVTYYKDLREVYSHICEDRVLDIAGFSTPNSNRIRLLVLIANKGALVIENGESITRTYISSGPTRLIVPASQRPYEINSYYGAADGSIGLIYYEKELSSKCLVEGRGLGSVVCMGWYLNSMGSHLAIGRHDGSVQLYLVDSEDANSTPRLKFTYFCGEPVTSVCGGCISTDENELIVSTFSGRIFALRSQHLIVGGAVLSNATREALASRRTKLEMEIARLENQAGNEREKYQKNTRSFHAGLSVPPLLDIQHELLGANANGWQEARITSGVPLDMLFIYSDSKLEMQTDNAAVLSICPPQGNASPFLATVRCQAGTRRVWLQMRTCIDSSGLRKVESTHVLIYILPVSAPRVAGHIKLLLPALPQYSQHEDPEGGSNRTWCNMRVSGGFSVAEMTSWLTEALPGDMPRPSNIVVIARSHSLLKTLLICRYSRGSANFKSDNISTLAIMKEILSNCSIKRSIRIEMFYDFPQGGCLSLFRNIKNDFITEYQKNKDSIIKQALSALDLDINNINDESQTLLCEDYLRIWSSSYDNVEKIHFHDYVDTVDQWFVDWCKLSLLGSDYSNQRQQLKIALNNCDLDKVEKILTLNVTYEFEK